MNPSPSIGNIVPYQVSIPKRASEALNLASLAFSAKSNLVDVSIPKRASEALNHEAARQEYIDSCVSIPKRASEALNLYSQSLFEWWVNVSIPKRASEALNLNSLRLWNHIYGHWFQSLKGLQRLWIALESIAISRDTVFQSLKGLQRLWIFGWQDSTDYSTRFQSLKGLQRLWIADLPAWQAEGYVSIPKRASEALNL